MGWRKLVAAILGSYVVLTLAWHAFAANVDWGLVATLRPWPAWIYLSAAISLAGLYLLGKRERWPALLPVLAVAIPIAFYTLALRRIEYRPADARLTEYWLTIELSATTLADSESAPWCYAASAWSVTLRGGPGQADLSFFRGVWPSSFSTESLAAFAFPSCEEARRARYPMRA